jgi:Na+-transporting methylmalonyl-CoA/oxaloacetate decarboxylase gamma subunit
METLLAGISILLIVYIVYILITAFMGEGAKEFYAKVLEAPQEAAPQVPQATQAQALEVTEVKQLRDPVTGETAAIPTNYRFAKRWIKEAMVKEGLLDRVYRNTELQDEAIDQKVKEALERFKALKKYWA